MRAGRTSATSEARVFPPDGPTALRTRDDSSISKALGEHWLVVLPLALSAFTFRSILANYFHHDDFPTLYMIADRSAWEFLIAPYFGHTLFARNVVFYLTYQLFGTATEYYFVSVLLTHIVNVALAYLLIHRLSGNAYVAAFGASLWGASPLSEGTLGHYCVFGHCLVATALLIILLQAVHAVQSSHPPTRSRIVLWYLLALAAMTSFGTGIGIAMSLPLALWALLPTAQRRGWSPLPLGLLVVLVPAIYFGFRALHAYSFDTSMSAGPKIMLLPDSIGQLLRFFAMLLSYGCAGLFAGHLLPAWMTPPLCYALTALTAIVCSAAVWRWPDTRRPVLVCALLLAGCYGSIAMARAALFSPTDSVLLPRVLLDLARYHYVGQLLIAIIVSVIVARALRGGSVRTHATLLAGWCLVNLALYAWFARPIDHHRASREAAQRELNRMRAAIAARPHGDTVYFDNSPSSVFTMRSLFPGQAALFVIYFADNVVDGRRVMFLGPPVRGRRTKDLFVQRNQGMMRISPESGPPATSDRPEEPGFF